MESSDNLDRLSGALERIADALEWHAKIQQERFEREYPTRNPSAATVAVAKYPKDEGERAPEEQGEVFPGLGPRETKLQLALARNKARRPGSKG